MAQEVHGFQTEVTKSKRKNFGRIHRKRKFFDKIQEKREIFDKREKKSTEIGV